MRKLIVISFLTLDGVMQAPGAKDEDPEGGFKYGGWQLPFMEDFDSAMLDDIGKAGALLLGRKTYDIFAAYWPTTGKSMEWWGEFMNNVTKYVASNTLKKTEWQNSILLEGDVAKAVTKIKEEAGNNIYMFGSGDLCQTLMRHHLIDEYFLMIHPLTLGAGKRLFHQDGPKQDFELLKSKTTKSGILELTYKVKS
ncbi:dihydrofolate reductase family protein [Bdellovibrio bacteriovorus]|uniref:dihydrofolate reductase family protein n=1 Tax=Bdellovibrio TaxID=958 RepID=UPI0035A92F1E